MRRMSSTPAGLTLSQSERQTEDGPLKLLGCDYRAKLGCDLRAAEFVGWRQSA